MQTEAISNMCRYQLNDVEISSAKKIEIITALISHYEKVFIYNDSYHYYPSINLAYIMVIPSILFANDIQQNL